MLQGRYHHLFGQLTYLGQPVYGFRATSRGEPQDRYGRNIFLDTFDSAYGPGWRRENGLLTSHRPNGMFCYGFFPHDPYPGYPPVGRRPPGNGERYRVTVDGPGVTPVVRWEGEGLHDFDPRNAADVELEKQRNAQQDQLAAGGTTCRQH